MEVWDVLSMILFIIDFCLAIIATPLLIYVLFFMH